MADRVIKLPATFPEFARAAVELREALDARGIDPKARYSAELVFEEIVSNVIRHGCSGRALGSIAPRFIEVAVRFEENAIVMSFRDDGPPFDPRGYHLPEMPRSLEDASHGGLGLLLVIKAARRIEYEWARGTNNLTVSIAMAETAGAAAGADAT